MQHTERNKEVEKVPINGLNIFIEQFQKDAWKASGLELKLKDPAFPYSGLFDPPREVEATIAAMIESTGVGVARPIITSDPLTNIYQEKITFPFLYNGWDKLKSEVKMELDLNLGDNLHLATVPSGKIYPLTFRDKYSGEFAIIFDASLMFFYLFSFGIISSICRITDETCPTSNGFFQDGKLWWGSYKLDLTLSDLVNHQNEILIISNILKNLATSVNPLPDIAFDRKILFPNFLTSMLTDDLYVFLLSHELAHINAGHFESTKNSYPNDSDLSLLMYEEFTADIFGFSMLEECNRTRKSSNFSLYIHVNIFFHLMSYLYRTINYLNFKLDYGKLSPDVLFKVYFPENNNHYPHPLARLHSLRSAIRGGSEKLPPHIDEWDKKIDAFFENLWKVILINLSQINEPVSIVWKEIINHHFNAINCHSK